VPIATVGRELCSAESGSAELLRNDIRGKHRVALGQPPPGRLRKRESRERRRRELCLEPLELGTGRGEEKGEVLKARLCPMSNTEATSSGTARKRSSSVSVEAAYSSASNLTVEVAPSVGRTSSSVAGVRSADEQRTRSGSIPSRTRCLAMRFASRCPSVQAVALGQ
jgi:hypothetical protein